MTVFTDGIMVLGTHRRIRYVNEPAGPMLGRRHAELLGKNLWSEFRQAVGGPFHLAYEDALSTGHAGRLVDYYAPLERWFDWRPENSRARSMPSWGSFTPRIASVSGPTSPAPCNHSSHSPSGSASRADVAERTLLSQDA